MERLFELRRARVRPHEHRLLLERNAGARELRDPRRDVDACARLGRRPVRDRRLQRLLRAAEPRDKPVRELEHLRRRAVVLLEPNDARMREAQRNAEQPFGARAGEAVDRLIVVADDAEVVARPEPELEQRLLQQVHILVLVDGERVPLVADDREHVVVLFEQTDRALQQILEIERSLRGLPLLVLAEDAVREVRRQRRLVAVEPREIRLRREPPVLRPFDLRRQIAGGTEPVRLRQRVADPPQHERLRRHDPARIAAEPAQQSERGRVERRRAHAFDAERREPSAQFARGLVRERDRDDLRRRKRAARHLTRDPPRDRRRLAGSCAGEDADRTARCLSCCPLLLVQPGEDPFDVHRGTVATASAGNVTEAWRIPVARPRTAVRAPSC